MLSNELTSQRVRLLKGYSGRAVVRLRDYPLALEVPHPAPVSLSWQSAPLRMGRQVALIGRSYDYNGPHEEYIDLEHHHHLLVAAISGGGKSTLMRMALLTLALNTPATDLRMVLVDLKNDDLVPFKVLPHAICYAGDIQRATAAVDQVYQEKQARIDSGARPYRLLLVIDELAELGQEKLTLKQLGSILSTGRSLGVNVWAGTQYPSAEAIGSIVAASFTARIVGMVDGKSSALVATKRAGSGAELLQTPGDFLRIYGTELRRMKGYDISQADTAQLIDRIRRRWSEPVVIESVTELRITSYGTGDENATSGSKSTDGITGYDNQFPIREGRPLTEVEAQEVRRLAEAGKFDRGGKLSLNRAVMAVYGSKSPNRLTWIREALQQVQLGDEDHARI
jgi:DNA segregation ATPase FtsK/SpoIIIE-like protein